MSTQDTNAWQDILDNIPEIGQLFFEHSDITFKWAFGLVMRQLANKIMVMTQEAAGLQFNAKNASATFLKDFSMGSCVEKM